MQYAQAPPSPASGPALHRASRAVLVVSIDTASRRALSHATRPSLLDLSPHLSYITDELLATRRVVCAACQKCEARSSLDTYVSASSGGKMARRRRGFHRPRRPPHRHHARPSTSVAMLAVWSISRFLIGPAIRVAAKQGVCDVPGLVYQQPATGVTASHHPIEQQSDHGRSANLAHKDARSTISVFDATVGNTCTRLHFDRIRREPARVSFHMRC